MAYLSDKKIYSSVWGMYIFYLETQNQTKSHLPGAQFKYWKGLPPIHSHPLLKSSLLSPIHSAESVSSVNSKLQK